MEKEEQKLRFPNLKIITPVDTRDQSGRYSKEEVDRSRIQVTSIRNKDLHKITGGPYQLRKAKAYVKDWIEYMKARKKLKIKSK